ncbi:MAG: 5'/3'-nucleotidase SurE [Pseudomonadota bacterium]
MRILITNDDGITAPGLAVAEAIATELVGPSGEVWVVAPDFERSGVSHAISYAAPTRLTQIGERRYSCDGYPADCAIVGLQVLMRDTPPDLVLSGVNRGHNVAEDVVYSGTVGGAMEASLGGVRAIGLSQFYRRDEGAPADLFESARRHGAATVRRVLDLPWRRHVFYNVNFPACRADAVKGTTVCPQGMRANATFEAVPYTAPNGREYQFFRHSVANTSATEGSDARLIVEDWITVTPLVPQLTAFDVLEEARTALAASS